VVRSTNRWCAFAAGLTQISPEIYRLSGLLFGLLLQPDSTIPAMPKILLAEDDTAMRRFLVKALENAGFKVSPQLTCQLRDPNI